MRIIFGLVALNLLTTGCGGSTLTDTDISSGSDQTNEASPDTDNDTQTGTGDILTPQELVTKYAGATFVSVDTLEIGETADGTRAMGNWTISFTTDTVTWNNSDVVEVGTYTLDDSQNAVASISGRDLFFTGNGTSITWDSHTYLRLDSSLFDSQQSLEAYFNNTTYNSVEELDIGQNAQGGLAMGNWMVKFDGNEFAWFVQDTVAVGSYSYTDRSSFKVNFFDREVTAYVLVGDQLLIDSKVYQKASIGQFDSQETLIAYLDGTSYKSAELLEVGAMPGGIVALGHWFLNFSGDTFSWTYSDVEEAGTYSYATETSFTALLADRELTIDIDRGDIMWNDLRYIKE